MSHERHRDLPRFPRPLLQADAAVQRRELLFAAASRLPTWEVASPVEWLLGTVNVAFVPVFGPIIVFGCYCFTMLALAEVIALHREISGKPDGDALERVIVDHSGIVAPARNGGRERVANYAMRFWIFLVPLIAYTILFVTYLDFVRPSSQDPLKPKFATHRQRVTDMLLGTGGWGSFRPLTPSVYDNLYKRAAAADKKEEQERLRRVAELSPYIHAPLQAWGYLLGFFLMVYMAGAKLFGRIWTRTVDAVCRLSTAAAPRFRRKPVLHPDTSRERDSSPRSQDSPAR